MRQPVKKRLSILKIDEEPDPFERTPVKLPITGKKKLE